MTDQAARILILAKRQAETGVDYSPRHGALCPCCRTPARIYATRPWEGITRIRYHRCESPPCLLARLEVTIKSIEQDLVGDPAS